MLSRNDTPRSAKLPAAVRILPVEKTGNIAEDKKNSRPNNNCSSGVRSTATFAAMVDCGRN
jgi:hypothetical protein